MSRQEFTQPSGPASRRWLAAIAAAFLALGLVYSIIVPLFEASDEVWHFAFADHLAKGGGLPVFSTNKSAFLREGGQPPLYYTLVALAIAPLDRNDFPGWVRFNASHPAITPGATSDTPNVFIHTAREESWTGSVLAVHVARLVSLLFGVLTVAGVYMAGRIVTGREDLALLGAALVAFTPQFVFVSASVNNDSLAAATATWVGVAALQISNAEFRVSRRYAIGTGILLGLGLLAKLGGLIVIPLIGLAFVIRLFRLRSASKSDVWHSILDGMIVLGIAGLVSGWWFVRNIALYGDPLGWSVWLSDIGVRSPTPALWQLAPELPALFRTYWADLPGLPVSGVIYAALAVITLVALIGVARFLFLRPWGVRFSAFNFRSLNANLNVDVWNLIFVLAWFSIVLVAVLRYMQTTPAAQGRLLFPALAPIGALLAYGLGAQAKRAWLPGLVAGGLFLLTLAAPFMLIRPAFAKPVLAQLPVEAAPTHAQFGDLVELVGMRVYAAWATPGSTYRITTYWRALRQVPRDQRILLRFMRPDGTSGGQLDAMLGTPLYPTTLWRPGQIVVDTHNVRVDSDLTGRQVLRIHIGVGDELEPLLSVTGADAGATGDVADIGQVWVVR